MVGQDVLKLAQVSLKTGRKKSSLPDFFWFLILCFMLPLF
jgi:hypothetical protein